MKDTIHGMAPDAFNPALVFMTVYAAISFEWLHKAVPAILGVIVLFVLGVIDVYCTARHFDFEIIMLLITMIPIVRMMLTTNPLPHLTFYGGSFPWG